jgi:hypothetical protein
VKLFDFKSDVQYCSHDYIWLLAERKITLNKRNGRTIWNSLLIVFLLIASLVWSGPSLASADRQPQHLAACGTPLDACWENGFHLPGVEGAVYAIVQDSQGTIYVGGNIISAGGIPVNNLAMWNGTTWLDIGGGVTHTNPSWQKVYALAVDVNDNLYVGGVFDHAGSVPANSLAKWTGSAWETIGGGTNGSVMVIKAVSGGIYVGGYFSQVGSIAANNIAYRDFQTSSWVTLGSGVDDAVYAIEFEPISNSWFVGGDFFNAGGVSAYGIARYIGGGVWEAVGGGLLNQGGSVYTLLRVARDGGGYDLYVGGSFSQVGATVDAHNIARWDGSTWYALNYGTSGEVKAMVITASGDLIVAGDFSSVGPNPGLAVNNIAKWNAGTWSVLGDGLGTESYDEVNAVLLSETEVIAGGDFDLTGSQVVNNLAKWNGSWLSIDGGLGVNNVVNILLADGDSVFVSGPITHFGSLQAIGLAKLSGSTWSGEGSPADFYIRALVNDGLTTLYAGGAFTTMGGAEANYLASWNGSAWQELAGGTNGYVNALALDDSGKLYVGGEFTVVGAGNPAEHIAMWDGTWHTLGEGLDGNVRVLALDPDGNLYAGGEFYYAGSLYVNHIAMWDGSEWHALDGGLSNSNYVEALTFDSDNRLYAGGYFNYAGSKLVNGVAMWNGYEWSALGSGMDDGVGALAIDSNGYLYAGGDFETAGDAGANHIARWDGFTWSALGSGTDSNVFELAIPTEDRLIAGGVFKIAGGKPSSYIGAYTFPPPVSVPVPQFTNSVPANVLKDGDDFWLMVNGSNFSSRSVVRWNGDMLVTTYISNSQLKALVTAERITVLGTAAVTVYTPAPLGGGSSNALSVEIVDGYYVFLPTVIR